MSYNVVALDFECGNNRRDSVFQIGWAKWDGHSETLGGDFIKPPYEKDDLYYLRGNWPQIEKAKSFAMIYNSYLEDLLANADYVVAHNAPFDRKVLNVSCATSGLKVVQKDWINSVLVARKLFQVKHVKLASVARRMSLDHQPHDAKSDALITLRTLQAAVSQYGWPTVKRMVSGARLDSSDHVPEPRSLPSRSNASAARTGSITKERQVWNAIAYTYDREFLIEATSLSPEQVNGLTQDELVDKWAMVYDANLPLMLNDQLREDLQSACRALALDDTGYKKKLTSRLRDYADEKELSHIKYDRSHNHDNVRTLRQAIALNMTRVDLVDFVSWMRNPPPRYYTMSRSELEKVFIMRWDGDLEEVLESLPARTLKIIYEELGIDRPRLRAEMIDDLLDQYG